MLRQKKKGQNFTPSLESFSFIIAGDEQSSFPLFNELTIQIELIFLDQGPYGQQIQMIKHKKGIHI